MIDGVGRPAMRLLGLCASAGLRSRLRASKAEEAQGSWLRWGQESEGFCGTAFCGEVAGGWARAQAGLPQVKEPCEQRCSLVAWQHELPQQTGRVPDGLRWGD